MREVYFENILIADVQNRVAYVQTFQKGLNIITSVDNHVGKSSLLKSLYYTLGANIAYDSVWERESKLYILTISVENEQYRICRMMKRYAVFHGEELLLITDSATRELSPLLEKIFDFAVYLPNKGTGKIELAPPAFTFMPYYIDQDKGWSGLYESFENITQYKKDDRIKSLYYHLNIYTKGTVELMARRDQLRDQLDQLKHERDRLYTILAALREETNNLPPADTLQELDAHLQIPKQKIRSLVKQIGLIRNRIQELETNLCQQKHQLQVIEEYSALHNQADISVHNPRSCPRCGYVFDEEIFEIVCTNYTALNEKYMCQQIELIIDSVTQQLMAEKEQYVSLMAQLKQEEQSFQVEQDEFDVYVRQRGLSTSLRRFNETLGTVETKIKDADAEIRTIQKELRKLPNKEDVEEKYIEFVRLNIMRLDAWDSAYDGNIHLLKPIKAQGTLENKIILAQFIGLFQTMDFFKSSATRFPFVVDSPRAKEASIESSKEILKMIAQIDFLPQVILATINYSEFEDAVGTPAVIIELKEKRKLLNETDFSENEESITMLFELLKNA